MESMIRKNEIPEFGSEADEAAWWDAHRDETAAWMREAVERRQATTLADVLSKARHAAALCAVPVGIDPADLDRARVLAEKQGITCQSYVRKLLHEAIEREERKLAS